LPTLSPLMRKHLADLDRVETIHARIENTNLPDASFDIVHSCHTIEHLGHALSVLQDHHRVLKPGGLMLIDAPNVDLIGGADILEEWFIDKHLYHYSSATLTAVIKAAGFEIVQAPDPDDRENVLILARKGGTASAAQPDGSQVAHGRDLVASYRKTRDVNRAALREVAAELNRLSPKKVLLWGAGRLFDSLVLHGGFDPKTLAALVDTHLIKHMQERHGTALQGEGALEKVRPGVIVIMSRAFASEISAVVRPRLPEAEILFAWEFPMQLLPLASCNPAAHVPPTTNSGLLVPSDVSVAEPGPWLTSASDTGTDVAPTAVSAKTAVPAQASTGSDDSEPVPESATTAVAGTAFETTVSCPA